MEPLSIHHPRERLRVPVGRQRFGRSYRSLLLRWRHPGRWVCAVARRNDHHFQICHRHCSIGHQSGRNHHRLVRPTRRRRSGLCAPTGRNHRSLQHAGNGSALSTLFMGLNEGGFITGSYTPIATGPPGPGLGGIYVRLYTVSSRRCLAFAVPGADSTTSAAINDSNVMTGWSDSETNRRISPHTGCSLRVGVTPRSASVDRNRDGSRLRHRAGGCRNRHGVVLCRRNRRRGNGGFRTSATDESICCAQGGQDQQQTYRGSLRLPQRRNRPTKGRSRMPSAIGPSLRAASAC